MTRKGKIFQREIFFSKSLTGETQGTRVKFHFVSKCIYTGKVQVKGLFLLALSPGRKREGESMAVQVVSWWSWSRRRRWYHTRYNPRRSRGLVEHTRDRTLFHERQATASSSCSTDGSYSIIRSQEERGKRKPSVLM